LVVAGGVEDQVAQEFAGGRVDHADVQVLDQEQDVRSAGRVVGRADGEDVAVQVPGRRRVRGFGENCPQRSGLW
jgi:hypothetical protein